ncbi:NAD(P)-dependent oxidoreductase [Amnibacterium endophyticum]|uniref:NAD(P)-dependent oxidoreductase n=1 Tax=Amnibacterium endophyticum TaxID=2109337 RepID=A0ABW4LFB3_9MICO
MAEALRITVLGGSGYAGSSTVREAASRGHRVVAVQRHAPAERVEGAEYLEADATDDGVLDAVVDADVVVAALAPRGDLAGALFPLYAHLAKRAAAEGTRLIVIGGWSGLRPAEGAPRFSEGDVDPRFADEAREMVRVLEWLPTADPELQWLFVSPAAVYGAYAPGDATGRYRIGGEVALTNEDGSPTAISGADFARAVVDLAEGDRTREHVGVAS